MVVIPVVVILVVPPLRRQAFLLYFHYDMTLLARHLKCQLRTDGKRLSSS